MNNWYITIKYNFLIRKKNYTLKNLHKHRYCSAGGLDKVFKQFITKGWF